MGFGIGICHFLGLGSKRMTLLAIHGFSQNTLRKTR